jgi:putative sterol carrier protein
MRLEHLLAVGLLDGVLVRVRRHPQDLERRVHTEPYVLTLIKSPFAGELSLNVMDYHVNPVRLCSCLARMWVVPMSLYPTEQWLTAYGRALDGSAALDDLADGWGVGFNGDVLLAIEDVPLAETTIGELPDEVMADLPEDIRAGVSDVTLAEAPTEFGGRLRTALPASVQDLLHQIESKVHDGTIYAYVGLEAGDCTGTAVLETPGDREVGYVVHGPYETWRRIIDGRPAVSAVLSGDLGVTGNRLRLLRYASVLQLLGDIAAEVETTHLFPGGTAHPGKVVLDEAVRQPVILGRLAERQVSLATKALSPF